MSGTRNGGIKTAATMKRTYGEDYYRRIGHLGGMAATASGKKRGFAANPELAKEAGRIGGKLSRRGKRHPKYKIYYKGEDAGYWAFKSESEALEFYAKEKHMTKREVLNAKWESSHGIEKLVTFVKV